MSLVFATLLALVGGFADGSAGPAAIFAFTETGGPFARSTVPGLPATSPADCASCHPEVANEWRESMHAQSYTDPTFLAELRETHGTGRCIACHAPMAQNADTDRTTRREGVSCAACHVREGEVLAAHAPERDAPHPVRMEPQLAESVFCAGCHDFAFPAESTGLGPARAAGQGQQTTYREWLASPAASEGRACIDCHMPRVLRASGRAGRSHRELGLRDPTFVRESLEVEARASTRRRSVRVDLTLRAVEIGHALPTGDLFRQLRVRVSNGAGADERILMRHVLSSSARPSRRARADERLVPGEVRSLRLELPRHASTIRYDVTLLRLRESVARGRGLADSWIEIPLAEGEVRVEP